MNQNRDTDADWDHLGQTQPYWAVMTEERFRGQKVSRDVEDQFYQSGQGDVEAIHATLMARFQAPERFKSCLDFGCGLGRLLIPMAARADQAIGVDVAASMRRLCQQRLDRDGLNHVILVDVPTSAASYAPFAWINSYIVMQHIPPSRGLELIESLTSLLELGGYLSLHITTHRDPHLMPSQTRNPLRLLARSLRNRLFPQRDVGQITMYDYDLADVLSRLERLGCKQFHLEPTNHGGHHGFMIYTQRTQ